MRKLFLWLPSLWVIMLISFSCKKESINADIPQNPSYENLIPKIKSWLEEQKKGLPATSAETIKTLESNLSYDEIHLEKYKDSKEFIVIPILSGFKSKNNSDKDPANYLVLVFENQDSITRGNIIQHISSNSPKAAPKNTFNKIFTYQDIDCSGQFTILSITDFFKYELKFENGKLKSVTDKAKKTQPNNVSGRVTECIDWYLQTWYYWADGTIELISEAFLYTSCDGDCAQPRIANGRTFNNCGGGSGGGGNPIEYEFAVVRSFSWEVAYSPSNYKIMSTEEVSGVKVASETPYGGHFTGITHKTSFEQLGYGGWTWQELSSTVSLDTPYRVYAYTQGHAKKGVHSDHHEDFERRQFNQIGW